MNSIRVLLVDDEPLARRRLAQLLTGIADVVVVGECRNGEEALHVLQYGQPEADVVFLDVQMPDKSGIQVLQELKGQPLPLVVFVTAYDQYTLQAFEVHAVDYLLKPIDADRFDSCLTHLRRLLAQFREPGETITENHDADTQRLLVKQPGHYYFLPMAQVQYLEATGNYVTVYADGTAHLIRSTLTELERRLASHTFVRVHRSLVVNTRFVKELRPWSRGEYMLTLENGTHLSSSRRYAENIQRFLKEYGS